MTSWLLSYMGYFYILECSDGTYYSGSTKYLIKRMIQHQSGEGANYTKKRLPVKLVFFEIFERIGEAFQREKEVQRWSHKKKKALIEYNKDALIKLAKKVF